MKEHDEIREILRTFAASPNSVFSAEDACDALREYGDALVDVLIDALRDPVGSKNSAELQITFGIGVAFTQNVPFQPLEFT